MISVPRPFDGFVKDTKRVTPTCLVHFDQRLCWTGSRIPASLWKLATTATGSKQLLTATTTDHQEGEGNQDLSTREREVHERGWGKIRWKLTECAFNQATDAFPRRFSSFLQGLKLPRSASIWCKIYDFKLAIRTAICEIR